MTLNIKPSGGSAAQATGGQLTQIRSDLSVYSIAAIDALIMSTLARANHTGTQLAATISDITDAVQDIIGAMVVAAGGTYNDAAGTATFPGGGGGGGTVDTVLADGSVNAIANNAVFDALALKLAKLDDTLTNPTLNGAITVGGVGITTPTAMGGALIVDVTKPLSIKSVTADITLTFSGQPAQYTKFCLRCTNASGAARVVTIPSCFSIARQATITAFTLANNTQADLEFEWDGVKYLVQGDPVSLSLKALGTTFVDGGNDTQMLMLKAPHAGTILEITTQSDSGTAVYTTKINGAAVTATANNVSSTLESRVVTAANHFAFGDKITLTRSANSSCVNGSVSIHYAPEAP